MLGRRIAARQPPPTCLPELRRTLRDEGCNIPQDQIDNLILSMPKRYVLLAATPRGSGQQDAPLRKHCLGWTQGAVPGSSGFGSGIIGFSVILPNPRSMYTSLAITMIGSSR
ncbi:hypothetical protein TNCV_3357561 [Trichonephila clavipes]|nr:hypothetical protein TNCV_3357561 [Trichonephila clavipes]